MPTRIMSKLMHKIELRSVFFSGYQYDTKGFLPKEVEIADDEFIVNVETIMPNPSVGVGVRVWIGKLVGQ